MLRRRIAGTVCTLTVALLGLAVVSGAAAAAQSSAPSSASTSPSAYPAQSPLLTVSSGSVKVGGSILLSGSGFQSGEVIDIAVTYPAGSHALGSGGPVAQPAAFSLRHSVGNTVPDIHAVAAPDGAFSARVSLTQAGSATITATGEQSHLSVVAIVSVLRGTTVPGTKSKKQALPSSTVELLILVVAMVALLVSAGLAWRRRSRKVSPAPDVSAAPEVAAAHDFSTA